jgi:hypothetical protein
MGAVTDPVPDPNPALFPINVTNMASSRHLEILTGQSDKWKNEPMERKKTENRQWEFTFSGCQLETAVAYFRLTRSKSHFAAKKFREGSVSGKRLFMRVSRKGSDCRLVSGICSAESNLIGKTILCRLNPFLR